MESTYIDLSQFYPEAQKFVARVAAATHALLLMEQNLCPGCTHVDFCQRLTDCSHDGMGVSVHTSSTATKQAWDANAAPCQDPEMLKTALGIKK